MANGPESDRPTDRTTRDQGNQSLVSRWSRRKSEARARECRANHADDGQAQNAASADAAVDGSEDPRVGEQDPPSDADMPPIESLAEGSDYRGFLSPRVSESLQRAALRKLFQSPRFNVRDGLDDYDGDYTRYLPMGDDTVTAHAKFQAARLRERLGVDATSDGDPPPADEPRTRPTAASGSASRGGPASGNSEPEDADAPQNDPA